jgi:hypothetical protein
MDRSVLQDARFQPAPDQTDRARITASMLDKPENSVVTEPPEEVLQIQGTATARLRRKRTKMISLDAGPQSPALKGEPMNRQSWREDEMEPCRLCSGRKSATKDP